MEVVVVGIAGGVGDEVVGGEVVGGGVVGGGVVVSGVVADDAVVMGKEVLAVQKSHHRQV